MIISKKGKREYRQIAGERFPVKCMTHITVDVGSVEVYRNASKTLLKKAELEITEQRINDPDTPVENFMLIDVTEGKDGWFGVSFWTSL